MFGKYKQRKAYAAVTVLIDIRQKQCPCKSKKVIREGVGLICDQESSSSNTRATLTLGVVCAEFVHTPYEHEGAPIPSHISDMLVGKLNHR